MNRRNRLFTAVLAVCAASLMTIPAASYAAGPSAASATAPTKTSPPATTTLQPGRQVTFTEKVPVNVVLVGYDPAKVSNGIRAQLPQQAEPVVRYPRLYGLEGRDVGLSYRYDYHFVDAPKAFEDRFFDHVTRTAKSGPLTSFQQDYNDQQTNVLDVKGPVLNIDAPATERYLEDQARTGLGLRSTSAYTVFLVNWWGRKDFRFHLYHTRGTTDPDTGVNFDSQDSRAQIAWGGSSGRTWLYDLSAGPEAWTSNWNVDDPDLDGNGVPDYRMPPVWEYAANGNRKPSMLGSDLGKVVRYVAINELFTSSPLYDPLTITPKPGGAVRVAIRMLEGDPATDGTARIRPAESRREWRLLKPYQRISAELRDTDPIDAGSAKALAIWAGLNSNPGCWGPYGDRFAELFCYFDQHRQRYVPPSGNDYVEPVIAFNTSDAAMGDQFGTLGFADDNWVDGTQSFVFAFEYPDAFDAGFGFTTTTTHEVGHHLGMSHPHDGFDPATGVDYDALDEFFYAWSGDESDTVMSYTGLSNGFGVFDKDNLSRVVFAGYLNWANALLGKLDRHDLTVAETRQVARADELAARAKRAFDSWDYLSAAGDAYDANELVRQVAAHHGVEIDPTTPTPTQTLRFGNLPVIPKPDPIRFPDS